MTKIYEGNRRILIKWIERMYRALHEQGSPYTAGDGGSIDKLMKAIAALHDLKIEPSSSNVPVSPQFQVGQQWIDSALEEVFNFNAMGDEYICSTVEAVIKCNGIKKLFDKYETPMFFRGEHVFGWDLKSRIGRKLLVDWNIEDPHNVTLEEKRLLSEFQERCKQDSVLRTTVFGEDGHLLAIDHSGWWSLMQHYDDTDGTRMIDVTTSLYCALFFASANWDGTVDESIDGKLYMFPYQPGRGETDSPERHMGELIDTEDARHRTVDEYFKVEKHLEIPRFRVSPARNDRALSQDGYFVWQPYFNKPLYTFQLFPFRIHRDFKKSIVKELTAMGYTRDRILSDNRYGI
jgi:FRG domain